MATEPNSVLADLLQSQQSAILADWIAQLSRHSQPGRERLRDADLRSQCAAFLAALVAAVRASAETPPDIHGPAFNAARDVLDRICESRANQGFSPREVALFVFSLKQPLFARIQDSHGGDRGLVVQQTWLLSQLLDEFGMYTIDVYQKVREDIINRQQQEISELSTPVVKLWEGILALPLIGTLDSARTQVVMENLLQAIVDTQAEIAIIDITGVPTVDTLVAQHLIKTVSAARLMGADCIISGIRPQIAQTMVHLGVELNVITKATLAGALSIALQRTGQEVTRLHTEPPSGRDGGGRA